jgi:two-component system sensor histidine kinase BaeS
MVDGVVPADAIQLEKARAAAAGLSGVIGQLGELTQAEAAPLQRDVETVGLLDLANETVAGLEGMLQAQGVHATVEGTPAATRGDRRQLARALRNVVANAIQHSPSGGSVRVTVRSDASLRVTDEGSGIADEDRPYVFERFYRADRSRGRAGSGIGLTVARELVAANGGSIEIESSRPGATTFRIALPPA